MKMNKITIIIGIFLILLTVYLIFAGNSYECVYEKWHSNNIDNSLKENINNDLIETIKKWQEEGRIRFSIIDETDTISPVIINNNKDKVMLYYFSFFDKLTDVLLIKGVQKNNKWTFTYNGTGSYKLLTYETNEKSYKESLRKVIKGFDSQGFINSDECWFNEKLFEDFKFFEMGEYGLK